MSNRKEPVVPLAELGTVLREILGRVRCAS
jgi:hypothetical protein